MAIVAIILTLSSCGKYEEGPWFSLRTKKARLTGEWKVASVEINGLSLNDLSDYSGTYVYKKNNTGEYKLGDNNITEFEWEFSNDKKYVKTRMKIGNEYVPTWKETEILRLTNKEFWTTKTVLTVTTIVKYEKQ